MLESTEQRHERDSKALEVTLRTLGSFKVWTVSPHSPGFELFKL